MNFDELVKMIREVDSALVVRATKAVNISLTMRNWLIGHYVSEYELHGADRADYGKRILGELADRLDGVSNCNKRQLSKYVRFYRVYPQMGGTSSTQFTELLSVVQNDNKKRDAEAIIKVKKQIEGTASTQFNAGLIESLSYSHFEKLAEIDNETKRDFYLVECLQGAWTVKELKRQIGSLYYERSGRGCPNRRGI
jgi:hypothetical protein